MNQVVEISPPRLLWAAASLGAAALWGLQNVFLHLCVWRIWHSSGSCPTLANRTSTIKASTFDPRLSVFLQEKHKNGRNRLGTALSRRTLQLNPVPNQPCNSCPWPRRSGIGRKRSFFKLSPLNSPLSPNQVWWSSIPSPCLCIPPLVTGVWFFSPPPPIFASRSWRSCAKSTGLWNFPEQMLSQVRLSQN